ncbi:MAG: hypothetical protein FJZ47_02240 [Candidatus Tectomicrobia bacterium]|uniref:Putative glutamine amidotransferase domain-containing protein n=1 Tax=Tectimicrobiota bacterium TaxID=2528274 RepID=A0A938AZH6_UNCTE|nr:hypothetical protein [Candidatus Tectomicrobia bacterium]
MIALPFYPLLWHTASGTFRSSLTWEMTLSFTLTCAVAVLCVLLLYLQWRDLRPRVSLRVCWGLCLLRVVVYGLVLGMLLNPSLLIQKVLQILPPLLVMLDTSGSMGLAEAGKPSRLQQARDYLRGGERSALATLAQQYQLKLYQFDETARALPIERLEEVQPGGRSTDVLSALHTVLEEQRGTQPMGVLLLSDGAHHGSDTALGHLRQAGIRVVTAGVGVHSPYRDIRIASVQAPTLAFVHYPTEVNVKLQTWGYRGEQLPVVLTRAGRVVATRTVHVTTDVGEQQVQFELEPEEVGEFTYTVSVAPHLGEAITTNNHTDFPLSVARDKIRVLLVCGSPSWNYRFLRQGLKQDPGIDMISFVILRTPTDVVNVPENQLSLIPFPTQRLFTQELKNFDLIIFENFSYQLYFPWYYLENVRKYVHEGGAFAMLGGMLSFAQGGYTGTPIEDILPISMRQDRSDYRTVTQRMLLTDEGKAHPITRLASDAAENQRIWDMLPELDALNVVGHVKPGATVLGVSSSRVDDRPGVPLLAMQRFGEGRTLALMSDYIWKWNFQMAGRMDSNQHYLQFIRQMVRWLIRDPVLKQVRMVADASEFPVGSEVTGTVQVLQDDYRPAETATLSTKLRTPQGAELPVQYVATNNPGEYRYRFRADEEGIYTLDVQADIGGKTHEANRLLLRVQQAGDESQYAAPNPALLRDIAERTGGLFFALDDPARPGVTSVSEFFGGAPSYQVLEETRLRLRETLPIFFLMLSVLALEWWWRRRAGLL